MGDSRLRWSILNTLIILSTTFLIVVIFYFLNIWILEMWQFNKAFSVTDLFLIQGVVLILIGFIILLGRRKEVKIGAIWRYTFMPNGYLRIGLTIIYSGVTMILIYFLNLNI